MERAQYDKTRQGAGHQTPTQGGRVNQSLINYHGGIPEFDEYLKTIKKNEIVPEFGFSDYNEIVMFFLYRGEKTIGGFPIHKKDIIEIKSTHEQHLHIRKDSKLGGALELISGTMGIVGGIVAITADALTTGKQSQKTVLGSMFEILIKTEKDEPEKIILSCTDKNKDTVGIYMSLLSKIREPKIKEGTEKKKACYIATVCYGDIDSPEVNKFREYRDEKLNNSVLGRLFIQFYYFISPKIADYLKGKSKLNMAIKTLILDKIYNRIK